jgi:hypothetical protein
MCDPDPSELPLLPKYSALTWTRRSTTDTAKLHIMSLVSRADLCIEGRAAPGDTPETFIRLLKRAMTELPWPELPGGTREMLDIQLGALTYIAELGEPEAAVEILNRHVEDVERHVVAPKHVARYSIYRLDLLVLAASRADEGKRGAYLGEASDRTVGMTL